ncbi:MAG: hypothetical protein AAFN70_10545, partial [Planctomycetota bacterium]
MIWFTRPHATPTSRLVDGSLLVNKILTVLADGPRVKMPGPIPLPRRFVTIRWIAVAVASAILVDAPIQRKFVQIDFVHGGIDQLIL